jgi:hypothetical protein
VPASDGRQHDNLIVVDRKTKILERPEMARAVRSC